MRQNGPQRAQLAAPGGQGGPQGSGDVGCVRRDDLQTARQHQQADSDVPLLAARLALVQDQAGRQVGEAAALAGGLLKIADQGLGPVLGGRLGEGGEDRPGGRGRQGGGRPGGGRRQGGSATTPT